MATELHWPRQSTFTEPSGEGTDSEERRYVGPGTFSVPDSMVETYLDRGWQKPDQDATDGPEATTQPEPDADGDGESEPDADGDAEGFDAAGFVDDSWQSIVAAIEDGEADGHLEAVREAEQERDGEARTSIIEALDQQAG